MNFIRLLQLSFVLTSTLGLGFISPQAWAAPSAEEVQLRAYDQRVIGEIEFQGLKRIEKDALADKLIHKKGQKLQIQKTGDEIKAIYKMGYFDSVNVFVDSLSSGEVKLIYQIRERPVIAELQFDGNDKISTDDLKEVIKVKEWQILDIHKIRDDVTLIQKHYEDKGFYLTRVSYSIDTLKEDEVKLTYKVQDYEKVRIKKITFLNNKVFKDGELKKILRETQEGGLLSFASGSGSFKESGFKQDLQMLTLWYLDHGYVKFRYENPVVTVSDDKKWLYISIYVDEGEQYSMGEVDFSGDLLFPKEELTEETKLRKGDIFKFTQRNADIQKLTEKYQDLGYAFVNVIPKMDIHDDSRTVDINYQFEKGNLVYFGEIRVLGNSKTHDKVIRRELRIHEGELYSGSQLRISKERVERLGYFAIGEVIFNTVTRKGRDDIVDLEITVKERSTGTVTVGAGYGSLQKFFLTTNVSEINLFGKGQTISFQGQYAADARTRSANIGFTDPYAFDTQWSMGGDAFYVTFPIPGKYDMRKLGLDARLGYPLSDDMNAYITYKNEGLRVLEKAAPQIDASADEGVLSSVVWSISRDVRNNRFETSDGSLQSLSVETAGLGGSKKFVKLNLNNRFYRTLVGDLVFRNSIEYGHMFGIQNYPLPPSEKFYLGGPTNMKGFNPFSLGPKREIRTDDGRVFDEPLGGAVQMFALTELEHPLIREAGLKWVLFFDAGNSFAHFPGKNGEKFTIRTDAGFGVRWFSPIGPLRFEWGFPLKAREGEEPMVFTFYIGPPF